jgi:CHAD domain-containing protein
VEGVHHLRITTRRLRTTLELARGLTDPHWAERLIDELRWLACTLGAVRDLDVLKKRLQDSAGEDADSGALEPLFDLLGGRHAAAAQTLTEALAGERYRTLCTELADSAGQVPFSDEAWEPCRNALPALVDGAWKSLKRAGRALSPDDRDEDFHEVRKRAKRARYAAEAVVDALEPAPGRAAERFARAVKSVQDILGAHQDAVIAASELRQAALAHPDLGPFNFAAGRLLEREESAAAASRAAFFEIWRDVDRKKLRSWLRV